MKAEEIMIPVKNLLITDILGNEYKFKRAYIINHSGPNSGLHVKGRKVDEGLRMEIAYSKLVSITYEIDDEEVTNEEAGK